MFESNLVKDNALIPLCLVLKYLVLKMENMVIDLEMFGLSPEIDQHYVRFYLLVMESMF
jgi:hypothetical protein